MVKKEFISNVTGEVWHKENIKNWKRWYDKVGIVKEDIQSKGKNDTIVTLHKGSRVLINDIRGRIKPQYRVTDAGDKVWFIPIEKIAQKIVSRNRIVSSGLEDRIF